MKIRSSVLLWEYGQWARRYSESLLEAFSIIVSYFLFIVIEIPHDVYVVC